MGDGLGIVRSIESQSLQIIRNLDLLMKSSNNKNIKLELNSQLAEYLLNNKYKLISDEKSLNGHTLKIIVNNDLHTNKFSIVAKDIIEKIVEEKEVVHKPTREKNIRPISKKRNK